MNTASPNDLSGKSDDAFLGGVDNTTNDYSFNKHINNSYLQFLTNIGYMSKTLNRSYQFSSVKTALDSFASFDSSTAAGNSSWYTWSYDIFDHLFTEVLPNQGANGNSDWLSKFITIKTGDNGKWFTDELKAVSDRNLGIYAPLSTFQKTVKDENKTIDGYAQGYPSDTFDATKIGENLTNSEIWNWRATK